MWFGKHTCEAFVIFTGSSPSEQIIRWQIFTSFTSFRRPLEDRCAIEFSQWVSKIKRIQIANLIRIFYLKIKFSNRPLKAAKLSYYQNIEHANDYLEQLTEWTNVNFSYLRYSIEIASLGGLTLRSPEVNQSKQQLA